MLNKIIIAIFIIQLLTNQILSNKNVCHSIDDPHMKTFDGSYYEFHHDGSHFILYSDFRDTRVTAGYQKCVYNGARCNCAVYIKKQDTLAFLDFCKITEYVSPVSSRFYTVSKTAQNTYGPESIKPITCKPILPTQEDDEETWKAIIPANQYFKCAQIGDGNYITYVLRTYDPRIPGDAIKLKVDVGPLSMPRILLTPAPNSYRKTGGLCGMWNDNTSKDLYVLDDNGDEKYNANVNEIKDFWSLDSQWRPFLNGKRDTSKCPECFIKAERRMYCPCDDFSLTEELAHNYTRNSFCETIMGNCVEKSLHFPVSPPVIDGPTTTTTTITQSPSTTTYPSNIHATNICTNGINNNPGLKPIIQAGVYDPTNSIHNCIQDILLTGDNSLVNLHIELSIIEALHNVLHNDTYYINGTITDAGLALLIHLCPGGCAGHGQCVINQNCISVYKNSEHGNGNGNNNNQNILDCLSPVMCICPSNFGGPGCSTNIQDPPDFFLSETCCDVRSYKCEKVSGYGYPFARKTKLHYKIISSETDGIDSFENTMNGLTTPVHDNEFQVALPLNQVWKRNTSTVDVSIGISYNNARYKFQDLQLFDSKCRYCNGTINNEEIKPNTCFIENSCYYDNEGKPNDEDYICDVTNDIYEWTYIGYLSPECNPQTHKWSEWVNLDDPSGDGDIEIVTLKKALKCNASEIEVFTIDDLPAEKTNQNYYLDKAYGFICLNKDQSDKKCLDYKIRQCCPK